MIVILTGGTGFIGQAIAQVLSSEGYSIHLIARKAEKKMPFPCKTFLWPCVNDPFPMEAIPKKTPYLLIHLLGEPIAQWPWTKQLKKRILSSRVLGTKKIVESLLKAENPPQFFLSAGATAYYGNREGETVTEDSCIYEDQNLFLQRVCKEWEAEALKIQTLCRAVVLRFGMVLSPKGAFLKKQSPFLRRSFLPSIRSKKPIWLSWIALEDAQALLKWALQNKQASGIYNAAAPEPIEINDFYSLLSKKFKSRLIPFPFWFVRLLGGELIKNLFCSLKVIPQKALKEGFIFKYSQFSDYLERSENFFKK